MLDETKPEGRVVASALRLAAEKPWRDIAMLDIAEAADVSLAEMRVLFPSKTSIIARFMRLADDATLKALPPRVTASGQEALSKRDQLFEVLMTRFDVLQPFKAGLKSIHAAMLVEPELLQRVFASQAWMLHGAGITTDGLDGRVKVAGLVSIYLPVFSAWLEDDDAGHAKTMAALDRRLRRGDDVYRSIDAACGGVTRVARDLPALAGSVFESFRRVVSPRSAPMDGPASEQKST